MKKNNQMLEVQQLLFKQMKRLDSCTAKSEIQLEVSRSGALSQNAQAFLKSISISLRVKELSKMNPSVENEMLEEIGVVKRD